MKPEERALLVSLSLRLARIEALLMYAIPNLTASAAEATAPKSQRKSFRRASAEVFAEDFAQIARRSIELLGEEHPQFREELVAAAKEQALLSKLSYIDLKTKYAKD